MKFDVVLCEKPGEAGLQLNEVLEMFKALRGCGQAVEAYPIELQATEVESSAMGFITTYAADKLEYIYGDGSGLHSFIASILNDMRNEQQNGEYTYNGLRIKIIR